MYILNTLRYFVLKEEVKTGLKRLPNGIDSFSYATQKITVVKNEVRSDLGLETASAVRFINVKRANFTYDSTFRQLFLLTCNCQKDVCMKNGCLKH
jgi:hypothetical protein